MTPCIDHGYIGNRKGYRNMRITLNGKQLHIGLHVIVYMLATGEKPVVVRHRCDNARCISSQHLLGGDFKSNNRDAVDAGNNNLLRFGEDVIAAVRMEYKPRVVTMRMLAEKYGMTSGNVHHIISGRTRKPHNRNP